MPKGKSEEDPSAESMMSLQDQQKSNFYVFDSSLKSIFENTTSCTFSISKDVIVSKSDCELVEASTNHEGERHSESVALKKKSECNVLEPRKIRSWKECFFFRDNDPRLSEGLGFFNSAPQTSGKKFDDVRKNLKMFVRHIISKKKSLKIKKKFGRKKFKRNNNLKKK